MKRAEIFYCVLFLGICMAPSAGMLFLKQESSSENRELAEFPALRTEDGWNVEWLEQAGEYFQEHFALRNELVTANALVSGKVLETSTASGVIQGTDGWLYYKDSLADYQGTELMSERSIFNLSHTLKLMQDYVEGKGAQFLFAAAPNKNSLYDENMPYYYRYKVTEEKNLKNLEAQLEKEGVNFVSLYDRLQEEDEVLYHKRDSHWNNKGAALAAGWILDALGKTHGNRAAGEYTVRRDFEGDLDQMLYPLAITPEEEIYYGEPFTYSYTEEIESTFDPKIYTQNPEKEGSLIVYRDSFGNALLPFLAEEYGTAYFSRGIPYQLSDIIVQQADTVIAERAERFLPEMAQSAPVMPAPILTGVSETGKEAGGSGGITEMTGEGAGDGGGITETAGDGAVITEIVEQGVYTRISGRILPEYLETETRIAVRFDGGALYEASPVDVVLEDGAIDSGGFTLYIATESVQGKGGPEIFCITDDRVERVYGG